MMKLKLAFFLCLITLCSASGSSSSSASQPWYVFVENEIQAAVKNLIGVADRSSYLGWGGVAESNAAISRSKLLRPSDYSSGMGAGAMVGGVNLFTGQPSYSLSMFSISNGTTSWPVSLAYSGGSFTQLGQSNSTSPSTWVGAGWEMSEPGVMVNNMGTATLTDDIFYCDLGPYGGGQIVMIADSKGNYRPTLANNPQVQIKFYMNDSSVVPFFANQIIAWKFHMPNGKVMIFGDTNPSPSIRISPIRYQLAMGNLVGTVWNKGQLMNSHYGLPYRWDLNRIQDENGANALNFEYQYQIMGGASASNWMNQMVALNSSIGEISVLTNQSISGFSSSQVYVKSGYLRSIYSQDANGNKVEAIRFDLVPKTMNYMASYEQGQFNEGQIVEESQRLNGLDKIEYSAVGAASDSLVSSQFQINYNESQSIFNNLNGFDKYQPSTISLVNQGSVKNWKMNYNNSGMFYALSSISDPSNTNTSFYYDTQNDLAKVNKEISANNTLDPNLANSFKANGARAYWDRGASSIQCDESYCINTMQYFKESDFSTPVISINVIEAKENRFDVVKLKSNNASQNNNFGIGEDLWPSGYSPASIDPNATYYYIQNFNYTSLSRLNMSTQIIDDETFVVKYNVHTDDGNGGTTDPLFVKIFQRDKFGNWQIINDLSGNWQTNPSLKSTPSASATIYNANPLNINVLDSIDLIKLKNIYSSGNKILLQYADKIGDGVKYSFAESYRMLEKGTDGVWREMPQSKLQRIQYGTNEYGCELRQDHSGIAIFDTVENNSWSANTNVVSWTGFSGDKVVIFHEDCHTLLVYQYNPINDDFEKAVNPINVNPNNQYGISGYDSAGLTVMNNANSQTNVIQSGNLVYPMTFGAHITGMQMAGNWLTLSIDKQIGDETSYSYIFKYTGNRYKLVGNVIQSINNIYPISDNELAWTAFRPYTGNYTLNLWRPYINDDEGAVVNNSISPCKTQSGQDCNGQYGEYSSPSTQQLNPMPGGIIFQNYKDDGNHWFGDDGENSAVYDNLVAPSNKYTNGYQVRIFYKNNNWENGGTASPYTEVGILRNESAENGKVLQTLAQISYNPANGLMQTLWSTDGNGQSCNYTDDRNICYLELSQYSWKWYTDQNGLTYLDLLNQITEDMPSTKLTFELAQGFGYSYGQFFGVKSFNPQPYGDGTPQSPITVTADEYVGTSYGAHSPNTPIPVVTDVITSNVSSQNYVNRQHIDYNNDAMICTNTPSDLLGGIKENLNIVEKNPWTLLPQFSFASVQNCSNSTGACNVNSRQNYSFYIQSSNPNSDQSLLSNNYTDANGNPIDPYKFLNGSVRSVTSCGIQGEYRGAAVSKSLLYSAQNWPNQMVIPRLDSSTSISIDRNGIASRTDTKVVSSDSISGLPTKQRSWLWANGGRDLMLDSTRYQTYVDNNSGVEYQVALQNYKYKIPQATQEPSDLSPYLLGTSRTGFTGTITHTLIPDHDFVWLPPKANSSGNDLSHGIDLTGQANPDDNSSWFASMTRSCVNANNQVCESHTEPLVQGDATVYSSTIFEGPRSLPVASFTNAPLASVSYFGAEDLVANGNNTSWLYNSSSVVPTQEQHHTGMYSAKVTADYGPTVNIFLPTDRANEDYVISVWMLSSDQTPPILNAEVRQADGSSYGNLIQAYNTLVPVSGVYAPNVWQRYELRLSPAQLHVGGSFWQGGTQSWLRIWAGLPVNSSNRTVYVDDFITYPSKATFSIQAYDEYGRVLNSYGMDHRKTTTEYSPDGSASGVRDDRGRIFKQSFIQNPTTRNTSSSSVQ